MHKTESKSGFHSPIILAKVFSKNYTQLQTKTSNAYQISNQSGWKTGADPISERGAGSQILERGGAEFDFSVRLSVIFL